MHNFCTCFSLFLAFQITRHGAFTILLQRTLSFCRITLFPCVARGVAALLEYSMSPLAGTPLFSEPLALDPISSVPFRLYYSTPAVSTLSDIPSHHLWLRIPFPCAIRSRSVSLCTVDRRPPRKHTFDYFDSRAPKTSKVHSLKQLSVYVFEGCNFRIIWGPGAHTCQQNSDLTPTC